MASFSVIVVKWSDSSYSPVGINTFFRVPEHPEYDWEVSDTLTQFVIVNFGNDTTVYLIGLGKTRYTYLAFRGLCVLILILMQGKI